MDNSEFETEYQAWLRSRPEARRASLFDRPVGEIANAPMCVMSADAPVAEAMERLDTLDTGLVLVTEGDQLVGTVGERDLLRHVWFKGRPSDALTLREVMNTSPAFLPHTATLAQAMQRFAQASFRYLPLTRDGKPFALLSATALLYAVCETFPREVLNAPPPGSRPLPSREGA